MTDPRSGTPMRRIHVSISEVDYDYVVRELGGGEHGLATDIIRTLFTKFATHLRNKSLQPYVTNRATPARIRRQLTVYGQSPPNRVSRTAGH